MHLGQRFLDSLRAFGLFDPRQPALSGELVVYRMAISLSPKCTSDSDDQVTRPPSKRRRGNDSSKQLLIGAVSFVREELSQEGYSGVFSTKATNASWGQCSGP